jgi:hypothetical protein
MSTIVKTGCTILYIKTSVRYDRKETLKKRSRFTPSLVGIQLIWIFVKVIPVILFT